MSPVALLYLKWFAQVAGVGVIVFLVLARKRPDWSGVTRGAVAVIAGLLVLATTTSYGAFGRRRTFAVSQLKRELGEAQRETSRRAAAAQQAEEDFAKAEGSDDPWLAVDLARHGQRFAKLGEEEQAVRFLGRALEMLEAEAGGDRPWNIDSHILQFADEYIAALRETGDEAEAARVEALTGELRQVHAAELR